MTHKFTRRMRALDQRHWWRPASRIVWRTSNPETDRMREFKKYPNRRLYDIQESCYVTVEDIRKIILSGEKISVVDSKTDRNLTRTVLLQIIAEQECSGKAPVLTNIVLEHLIRSDEDGLRSVMSEHIERSIRSFLATRNSSGCVKDSIPEITSSNEHQE